jgi:hypothetical protein
MYKFLKDLWTDFLLAHSEIEKMRSWHIPVLTGSIIYFNREQYQEYFKNKEKQDEST